MEALLIALFSFSYSLMIVLAAHTVMTLPGFERKAKKHQVMLTQPLDYVVFEKSPRRDRLEKFLEKYSLKGHSYTMPASSGQYVPEAETRLMTHEEFMDILSKS